MQHAVRCRCAAAAAPLTYAQRVLSGEGAAVVVPGSDAEVLRVLPAT